MKDIMMSLPEAMIFMLMAVIFVLVVIFGPLLLPFYLIVDKIRRCYTKSLGKVSF